MVKDRKLRPEILLNAIDQDRMMKNYNLEFIDKVAQKLSIPLIACGGAKDAAAMKQ